jgi:nitroreductase
MDFRDLLKTRRAVRVFQDKEVSELLIREIIADICEAPSGANMQPWSFIIIMNKDVMKRISDESKKNILDIIEECPSSFFMRYKAVLEHEDFNVFYDAPCVIYITGQKDCISLDVDCTLAASYFMLSEANHGLGTCWIELGSVIKDHNDLRKEIGLPDDYRIVSTLILGYPKIIPPRPPRKEPFILKVVY